MSNPYGENYYVLQSEAHDIPELYQTGIKVSLDWAGTNAFRTEGRVSVVARVEAPAPKKRRRRLAPGHFLTREEWLALPTFEELSEADQVSDARFNTRTWISEPPY